MSSIAEVFTSLSLFAWPGVVFAVAYWLQKPIGDLIHRMGQISVKAKEIEVVITPTLVQREMKNTTVAGFDKSFGPTRLQAPIGENEPIPTDYLFLDHDWYFDETRQAEFKEKVPEGEKNCDVYIIWVILDSFYEGAMDRVVRVNYYLHATYPHPIQVRLNRAENFLFHDLASGEYVLTAEVFLKDRETPLILQRYISLVKGCSRKWGKTRFKKANAPSPSKTTPQG